MDNETNRDIERNFKRGRIWTGLFILGIGALFLIKQMGYALPAWLFTWPTLLIALGFFMALRHRFRGGGWFVLMLVGGIFLYDQLNPGFDMHKYLWPLLLISLGALMILRPRRCRGSWRRWRGYGQRYGQWPPQQQDQPIAADESQHSSKEDYIDVTSIFGGVKKIILSKNFKGGDITNFMGGTEVNLSQADIQGTVRIDATNIFGGAKLVIPASWDVKTEATAIFGGIEDKRDLQSIKPDPNKLLILDGTCIFGGMEIRNY